MLEFLKNKKILVVVAHPDDEILGLGGTMNMLISEYNAKVKVVILGEGIKSRSDSRNKSFWEKELKEHKKNIKDAQKKIGYHQVKCYDFPDNRFDTVPLLDIIKVIETEKESFNPDVIFTHHSSDLNIDHKITFQSTFTSARPMNSENVKLFITFETSSGTEWMPSSEPDIFKPNLFITLKKENIDSKISAMECYEFEKRKWPHPRSPEALKVLSKYRGYCNGVDYAEAFRIIRFLN